MIVTATAVEPALTLDSFVINLACQATFPLAKLPDHVPHRRGGKRLHISTGFRWAKGVRRKSDGALIALPTIAIGGTKCTSVEALQWFCEQLSQEAGQPGRVSHPAGVQPAAPLASAVRSPTARRRAHERAEKELDAMGV